MYKKKMWCSDVKTTTIVHKPVIGTLYTMTTILLHI